MNRPDTSAGTTPTPTTATGRRAQLRAAADAYLEGLAKKDFSLIPYADGVTLRAPLCPGGVHRPLVGKEALRTIWWAPLPAALGAVRVIDHYVNEDLTAICVEAEVHIVGLARPLRVADRFTVNAAGQIIEQENHFDPRDVTNPGWQTG
jgi:hypothetical protein